MPTQQNKPWTEEDDRLLMEMRAAGRSTFSICAALKRSSGAVKARIAVVRARVQAQANAGAINSTDDAR
jgi:hypothetical protein